MQLREILVELIALRNELGRLARARLNLISDNVTLLLHTAPAFARDM